MKIYRGKEPCAGCQQTGESVPRIDKNALCDKCKDYLRLGKELSKDFDYSEYCRVTATWYKLQFCNSENGGIEIESAIYGLMDSLHRDVSCMGAIDLVQVEGTTARKQVVMRKEYALHLKKLVDSLQNQQSNLRENIKKAKQEAKDTLIQERNKIFNDGLSMGKSLLLQLNNGEISMDYFSKEIKAYS